MRPQKVRFGSLAAAGAMAAVLVVPAVGCSGTGLDAEQADGAAPTTELDATSHLTTGRPTEATSGSVGAASTLRPDGGPTPGAPASRADDVAVLHGAVESALRSRGARFTIELDLHGLPGLPSMSGEGEIDGDTSRTALSVGDVRLEIVTTPDWVFERFPGSNGWVKVRGGPAVSHSNAIDPRRLLDSLLADGTELRDHGVEALDRRGHRRLSMTADLGATMEAGIEAMDPASPARGVTERMRELMSAVEVTVWIDEATGSISRVEVDFGEALGGVEQITDFSDWGDPAIHVDVPTEARELSLDELVAMGPRFDEDD